MKKNWLMILFVCLQVKAEDIKTSTVETWLDNSESGLYGSVSTLIPITLANSEKAFLAKLDSDEMNYALVRPKLKKAQYLDDLSDDLSRSYNHSDIVTIDLEPTILILEGGGGHQGVFSSDRKFISFDGWQVQIHHDGNAEYDNTGACMESGEKCETTKTTYKIVSKKPLVIKETSITEKGSNIDNMKKVKPVTQTINIELSAVKSKAPSKTSETEVNESLSHKHELADVENFDIVGVKLYMTEKQVLDAIQSKWKLKKEDLMIKRPTMGLGVETQIIANIDNQRIITNLNRPKLDNAEKVPVVDTIVYEMSATQENQQAMRKKALQKYGQPTGQNETTMVWCGEVRPRSCNNDTHASLTLVNTKLGLIAPTHATEIKKKSKLAKM